MKRFVFLWPLLLPLAVAAQPVVPATTTFTRSWLRSIDAGTARTNLDILASNTWFSGWDAYTNDAAAYSRSVTNATIVRTNDNTHFIRRYNGTGTNTTLQRPTISQPQIEAGGADGAGYIHFGSDAATIGHDGVSLVFSNSLGRVLNDTEDTPNSIVSWHNLTNLHAALGGGGGTGIETNAHLTNLVRTLYTGYTNLFSITNANTYFIYPSGKVEGSGVVGREDIPFGGASNLLANTITDGSTIVFMSGHHTNSGTFFNGLDSGIMRIYGKKNLRIVGEPGQYFNCPTGATYLLLRECEGVEIYGLSFFGDKTAANFMTISNRLEIDNSVGALALFQCRDVRVHHNTFSNLFTYGIAGCGAGTVTPSSTNIEVYANLIVGCGAWTDRVGSGTTGFWSGGIYASPGWDVHDNAIISCTTGIKGEYANYLNQKLTVLPFRITQNAIVDYVRDGIVVAANTNKAFIIGNYLQRPTNSISGLLLAGPDNSANNCAIRLYDGTSARLVNNFVIGGNFGIYVRGADTGYSINTVVQGCVVSDNRSYGIVVDFVNGWSVEDCQFYNIGTEAVLGGNGVFNGRILRNIGVGWDTLKLNNPWCNMKLAVPCSNLWVTGNSLTQTSAGDSETGFIIVPDGGYGPVVNFVWGENTVMGTDTEGKPILPLLLEAGVVPTFESPKYQIQTNGDLMLTVFSPNLSTNKDGFNYTNHYPASNTVKTWIAAGGGGGATNYSAGHTNPTHFPLVAGGTNNTGAIKTVSLSGAITLTEEGQTNIVIGTSGASGEANTASDLGSNGLFRAKSGVDLQFAGLRGTKGITLNSNDANYVEIEGSGPTNNNLGQGWVTLPTNILQNPATLKVSPAEGKIPKVASGATTWEWADDNAGGNLQTNANQFGASVVLTVKSDALLTNVVSSSNLTVTGNPLMAPKIRLVGTNGASVLEITRPTGWGASNALSFSITNPTAGQVLKINAVSGNTITLTNDVDGGTGNLQTNVNQFGQSVVLTIKASARLTNSIIYASALLTDNIVEFRNVAGEVVAWLNTNGILYCSALVATNQTNTSMSVSNLTISGMGHGLAYFRTNDTNLISVPAGTEGQILMSTNKGGTNVAWVNMPTGGTGTPGGLSGTIQFNEAGSFNGTNYALYDYTNGIAKFANVHVWTNFNAKAAIVTNSLTVYGDVIVGTNLTVSNALNVTTLNTPTLNATNVTAINGLTATNLTNGLLVPIPNQWSGSASNVTWSFLSGNWQQHTNRLATNAIITLTNMAAGLQASSVIYGPIPGGSNYHTVRFVEPTAPAGVKLLWMDPTNGSYDFQVPTNQCVLVSLFCDRSTNIIASWTTNLVRFPGAAP